MFLVEGGMSFDTRNAVAGARAFQRELKNTGKVAEDVSRQGANLERGFSQLGDNRTRSAIKNLAISLANAKDATEATTDAARALQTAFVKSLAGTAIISGAGALANVVRDVGAKITGAADESARAMNAFKGFATSLDEGRQRSDALSTSADNTLKALEGLKNAGIFQAGVFKLFGGENVLKDLEDATRGAAMAEFGAGAQAERITAERRVGMTPEQIAADKRKQEEEKRLREAREKGGPRAEADVARTIAAENLQRDLEKGLEAQKKFDADVSASAKKAEDAKRKAKEETRKAEIDGLDTAQKIIELEKEAASVSSQLAEITKNGIYGTDEKRKAQLEEIENLNMRLLDLEKLKADAIKQQALEAAQLKIEKQKEAEKAAEIEVEENKRQRESGRTRAEAQAGLRQAREAVRQKELEEQLRKFFGSGTWSSIPENIRQQMVTGSSSEKHLSMISRNTQKPTVSDYGVQPGGRIGRPASGLGLRRPPGYVPKDPWATPVIGVPSGSYRRTRMRGEGGQSVVAEGELANAIRELANKIPASVPV